MAESTTAITTTAPVMYSTLLAVDPGTSTGYAVFRLDRERNEAIILATADIKLGKTDSLGEVCVALMEALRPLLEQFAVEMVAYEDYYASFTSRNGMSKNIYLRAAISILCTQLQLPYHVVPITTWKKVVCGRSRPNEQEKQDHGKAANKGMVLDAVRRKCETLILARHSDHVDAIAIGMYCANSLPQLKNSSSYKFHSYK